MKLVIFGCGNIAHRIAKSCKQVKNIQLVGFASKNIDKAKQYCDLYECNQYGDYDFFLDSDVDVVYIATYNPSHYELIKKCLNHKKHVICEKPMLESIDKLNEVFDLAKKNNVVLMEGLKSVFLPLITKIKELIDNNTIGNILEIKSSFMRCGHHPVDHWINDPVTGGALKDLGSYCAGTMNYIMNKPGKVINIKSDRTEDRADTSAFVELDYAGIKGSFSVSNSIDGDNNLFINGDKGYVQIENFWKNNVGFYTVDNIRYELEEELISDFYYELKHFSDLIKNNMCESEIMSREASINILEITGVIK